MIDVAHGVASSSINASDFEFRAGTSDTPWTWSIASPASFSFSSGGGDGGSDRIIITWADDAIKNKWLKVTMKKGLHNTLSTDDTFYFGNLVGDVTGNYTTTTSGTSDSGTNDLTA